MVKLLYEKLPLVTDYTKTGTPQNAMMNQWLRAFGMIAFCGVLLAIAGISKPWQLNTSLPIWVAAFVAGVVFFKLGKFLSTHIQYNEILEKEVCWSKLSVREVEVAKLLLTTLTNKEICAQLFIEYNTLKTHIRSIYRKTNCNSRSTFIKRFNQSSNETNS